MNDEADRFGGFERGPAVSFLLWSMAAVIPATPAAAHEVGEVFRDCDWCPEMLVVPAGRVVMGSPDTEDGRYNDEGPQHEVTIHHAFAVGVYEVTFDEWDACVHEVDVRRINHLTRDGAQVGGPWCG